MRRATILISTATLAVIGMTAGTVSATATDDQAAADAAIASFNARMTDAGGVSDGPPDMTAMEDEELTEDDPLAACFGDFAALDPGVRLEGETARAFSDDFTFMPADQPVDSDPLSMAISGNDSVSAAVVTVDADQEDVIDELVGAIGSDEAATCLEDVLGGMAAAEESEATSPEVPMFEVDAETEFDLGVGDASASLTLRLASVVGGEEYEFDTDVYVARVDRSLVLVTISSDGDRESDIDGQAELAAIVDSL